MTYDIQEYAAFLVKGDLHGAIAYLKSFEECREMVEGYMALFKEDGAGTRGAEAAPAPYKDPVNQLVSIYRSHYIDVFWLKEDQKRAEVKLFQRLWEFCGSDPTLPKDAGIEDRVKEIAKDAGVEFLGGRTSGYYGAHIWKSSTRKTYPVEIPSGLETYSVIMMEGFLARGWLDYISLGKVGTGGWIDEEGLLCCIASVYDLDSPNFTISFLKHEAQHAYDKRRFPQITSSVLEYRAKLVELIYWEGDEIIKMIHMEADEKNAENAHALASHRIISDLSKVMFGYAYENDRDKFSMDPERLKRVGKALLHSDTERLKLGRT